MKKFAIILLIIALCFASVSCEKKKEAVCVFYTSDVHCGVSENMGLDGLKALVEETKETYPNTLLVDCGDFLSGGNLGILTKGSAIIELMNGMDYDAVTFGNHEFDYGMDRLKELIGMADFDLTVCNVNYTGSKSSVFEGLPEYLIRTVGNMKVGFIGVLTPKTPTSSTPSHFMEDGQFVYDFCGGNDGQDLYDRVQKTVDEVRSQKVDYVLILSHLGSVLENSPYDSISLIANTTGIDAVIDGHSHSVIIGDMYQNKEGKDVLLTSVGTKLENVGQLIIDEEGNVSSILISSYDKKDQAMSDRIAAAFSELDVILKQKVCDLDFDLPITDEQGLRIVRNREATPADLTADSLAYVMGAEIAMVNGGSVRSTLNAGEITYGDLLNVNSFGDHICMVKATGQQILDALEFGARSTDRLTSLDGNPVGENGGFLQVSGLKYSIDTGIISPVVLDENNMMKEISGERRVHDVMVFVNGEYIELDPEAYYTIAMLDYLAKESGDGNTAFNGAEVLEDSLYTVPDCLQAYMSYMNGADDAYRQVQGRIIVD